MEQEFIQNGVPSLLMGIDATPKHAEFLRLVSSGFRDARNFGARLFDWLISDFDLRFEPTPLYLLLRHSVELLDSMAVLIENRVIDPCWLSARSLFEISLQIDYLTVDPDHSCNRSIAYMTCTLCDVVRQNDRIFGDGKLQEAVAEHPRMNGISVPQWLEEYSSEISSQIKSILQDEPFNTITQKYLTQKRPQPWYTLDGGPTNLSELARHLKRHAEYLTLYPDASRVAHGFIPVGSTVAISMGGEGVAVSSIRNPLQLIPIAFVGLVYARLIFESIVTQIIPNRQEELDRWITGELNPVLDRFEQIGESFAAATAMKSDDAPSS